jgi:hypothetical protein
MAFVVVVAVLSLLAVARAEDKGPLPPTVAVTDPKVSDKITVAQLRAQLQEMRMQVLSAEARATQCQWQGANAEAQARISDAAKAVGIKDPARYEFDPDGQQFRLRGTTPPQP